MNLIKHFSGTADNLRKLNSMSVSEAHNSVDTVDNLWECTSEGTSYTDASAFSDATGASELQPSIGDFQGCSDQNSVENPAQLEPEGSDKERFAGWDHDLKERCVFLRLRNRRRSDLPSQEVLLPRTHCPVSHS